MTGPSPQVQWGTGLFGAFACAFALAFGFLLVFWLVPAAEAKAQYTKLQ
jgi:hypothetical protein